MRFPPLARPASLIVALAVSACSSGSPEPTSLTRAERTAIAQEVNARVDGLFAAMNAHDVEALTAFYENSEDFAYVGVTSMRQGWEQLTQAARMYHGRHDEVEFVKRNLLTRVLTPTVAVVVLAGASSDAESLMWSQTWVLNDAGEWVIALEHESWPGAAPPPAPHDFGEVPGAVSGDTSGG